MSLLFSNVFVFLILIFVDATKILKVKYNKKILKEINV